MGLFNNQSSRKRAASINCNMPNQSPTGTTITNPGRDRLQKYTGRRQKLLQNLRMWPDRAVEDMSESSIGDRSGRMLRRNSLIVSAAEREFEEDFASGYHDDDDIVDEGDIFFKDDAYFTRLDEHRESKKAETYKVTVIGEDAPTLAETTDSSSESDNDSLEERETKVRFSTVSIRTYSLTVGTHTKVNAYPLTLDWAHTPTETIDLELFQEVFCTARTKPKRKVVRGFRRPQRLKPAARFQRIQMVTGKRQEYIYEMELARTVRENVIPKGACCSDDGYVEDESRTNPYELCDIDDYQTAEF